MITLTPDQIKIIELNAMALATTNKEGNPHCIAVGDVKVVSQNQLLIGDNYLFYTTQNIQRNNNVSMVVWSRNWEEKCVGFEFIGKMKYFTGDKWHKMVKKIHEGFPAKGALLLTIEKIKQLA